MKRLSAYRSISTWLLVLGVVGACGVSGTGEEQPAAPVSEVASTAVNDDDRCPRHDGYPVVWRWGRSYADGLFVASDGDALWEIDESQFWLMSAYWAKTPNVMVKLDATARACVGKNDRWVVMARPPDYEPPDWGEVRGGDLDRFDTATWDRVVEHPWRLTRWGEVGSADQTPHYEGVVLFGDEIATISAACDARPAIIQLSGSGVAPIDWPAGNETMVCVPPPGIEPLALTDSDLWLLPIGGAYSIEDGELVIVDGGFEYRYVAISLDEFEAEFARDSFYGLVDPLGELESHEVGSFEELDNPPPGHTSTTAGP